MDNLVDKPAGMVADLLVGIQEKAEGIAVWAAGIVAGIVVGFVAGFVAGFVVGMVMGKEEQADRNPAQGDRADMGSLP